MLVQLAQTAPIPTDDDLAARADAVAAIAAENAEDVDRRGRFPREALSALKAERLLGAMVPVELGGEGASVAEIADVCHRLGQACASTAMIYAMHQIKAACLVNHYEGSLWHADFLREAAIGQLLLASSTTEGGGGGDVRSSTAPIERDGAFITLERAATVMSYGAQADAVVTTARRAPDAAPSDQVLVVFRARDYVLTETGTWETLGMRGTRSAGFALKAEGHELQILPDPYCRHPRPDDDARGAPAVVERVGRDRHRRGGARAPVPAQGRSFGPDAAGRRPLQPRGGQLRALHALIAEAFARYEGVRGDPRALTALDFQSEITLLKVEASELAVSAVMAAMRTCGLSGYREDGAASQGRALRDILSAPIMINNDRILANLGASALMADPRRGLFA